MHIDIYSCYNCQLVLRLLSIRINITVKVFPSIVFVMFGQPRCGLMLSLHELAPSSLCGFFLDLCISTCFCICTAFVFEFEFVFVFVIFGQPRCRLMLSLHELAPSSLCGFSSTNVFLLVFSVTRRSRSDESH